MRKRKICYVIFALLSALIFSTLLCACGNDGSDDKSKSSSTVESKAAEVSKTFDGLQGTYRCTAEVAYSHPLTFTFNGDGTGDYTVFMQTGNYLVVTKITYTYDGKTIVRTDEEGNTYTDTLIKDGKNIIWNGTVWEPCEKLKRRESSK